MCRLLAGLFSLLFSLSALEAQEIRFPASQFGKAFLTIPQSGGATNLETLLNERSDNFELVDGFSDGHPIKMLSRPVGRLDILVREQDGGEWVAVCTATLISDDHVITANHCFEGINGRQLNISQVRVRFGFYGESSEGQDYRAELPPLERSRGDDYAILRVEGSPGKKFGTIKPVARTPGPREELIILHYPLGKPLRVTRRFCRTLPNGHVVGGELRHRCDTLPGSSGAPVLTEVGANELIGIHVRGGLDSTLGSFNVAKVVENLSKTSKFLRDRISLSSVVAPSIGRDVPIATLPSSFLKPRGYFTRQGEDWFEYNDGEKVPFAKFKQESFDRSNMILSDYGRDMYVKLPINGGWASSSKTNPIDWKEIYFVSPMKATDALQAASGAQLRPNSSLTGFEANGHSIVFERTDGIVLMGENVPRLTGTRVNGVWVDGTNLRNVSPYFESVKVWIRGVDPQGYAITERGYRICEASGYRFGPDNTKPRKINCLLPNGYFKELRIR